MGGIWAVENILRQFRTDFIERFTDRTYRELLEEIKHLRSELKVVTEQTETLNQLPERLDFILTKIEEKATEHSAKLDALQSQQVKAFGEITAEIEKLKSANVTPEELQKAIDEAKAAQKTADDAEFDSKVDAAFAVIGEKVVAMTASTQKLDDIVPDVVAAGGDILAEFRR